MLKMMDRIWFDIKRNRRRSFLNYYYILFKLVEPLGQTELLLHVRLRRTRLRLRRHDFIWKKVCDDLGWIWKQTDIAYTNQSVKPMQGAYKKKPKDPVEL